jgi:hypothetical protein
MDSLVNAAARALARGDPLGALSHVARRNDPPALALRGTALAQLGELGRARELLRRAARDFGPREELARARCVVAEAEVALAARDLLGPPGRLAAAVRTLERLGDGVNVLHARLCAVRQQLLLGRVSVAERALAELDTSAAPPRALAVAELLAAEIALRHLETERSRTALGRAREAAARAGIPMLEQEIERAARLLSAPAARLLERGAVRVVGLEEAAALIAAKALVVNACRRNVTGPAGCVSLARRPTLFHVLRVLGERWPDDASRAELCERVFGARRPNSSHRARLRVEVGRLRRELRSHAELRATAGGFALEPLGTSRVVVLAPPVDGEGAALLGLLADGAAWSTSAAALALGASQRTVQRELSALEAAGQVRALGRGRARRWLAPSLGEFATALLLPVFPLSG